MPINHQKMPKNDRKCATQCMWHTAWEYPQLSQYEMVNMPAPYVRVGVGKQRLRHAVVEPADPLHHLRGEVIGDLHGRLLVLARGPRRPFDDVQLRQVVLERRGRTTACDWGLGFVPGGGGPQTLGFAPARLPWVDSYMRRFPLDTLKHGDDSAARFQSLTSAAPEAAIMARAGMNQGSQAMRTNHGTDGNSTQRDMMGMPCGKMMIQCKTSTDKTVTACAMTDE